MSVRVLTSIEVRVCDRCRCVCDRCSCVCDRCEWRLKPVAAGSHGFFSSVSCLNKRSFSLIKHVTSHMETPGELIYLSRDGGGVELPDTHTHTHLSHLDP